MNLKKYLDNSADSDTIVLSVSQSYNFEEMANLAIEADYNDMRILQQQGLTVTRVETSRQILADLIREVWDTAYNHGYHDAQADEGLTLAEMTD